jgi:hypothetical protein
MGAGEEGFWFTFEKRERAWRIPRSLYRFNDIGPHGEHAVYTDLDYRQNGQYRAPKPACDQPKGCSLASQASQALQLSVLLVFGCGCDQALILVDGSLSVFSDKRSVLKLKTDRDWLNRFIRLQLEA